MIQQKLIVLAAGGTGGHVFPARAVADKLEARGDKVVVMTDERGAKFWDKLESAEIFVLPSGGLVTGSPITRIKGILKLVSGYRKARGLLKRLKPNAVAGFGGYPSVPPMMAAQHKGIPTVLHEQNSVMGKANRLTARRARKVATSFDSTVGAPENSVLVGNPVRKDISDLASTAYTAAKKDGPFNLFVMGGSLGAGFFSRLIPEAVKLLSKDEKDRLRLHQQVRSEDLDGVRDQYDKLGIDAQLEPFVSDVASAISNAHLVICRAGATSVCEMAAAGQPAIFIPLDMHADRHQVRNAESLSTKGAAWVEPQTQTSPEALVSLISNLMNSPDALKEAADKARGLARPNATDDLVSLIDASIAG